jgi:hypothetical protein
MEPPKPQHLTPVQRAFLLSELPRWESEGLLPPASRGKLLALYAPPDSSSLRGNLAGFASLFLFFALMLLVSFNWSLIPPSLKVVGALLLVGGAHAGAAALEAGGSACASGAARFFGCLAFGVALWLLLQVSHTDADNDTVGWWWAAGTLGALVGAPARAPGDGALHGLLAALNAVALASAFGFFSSSRADFPYLRLLGVAPLLLGAVAAASARGSALGVALHLPALLCAVVLLLGSLLGLDSVGFFGAVGAALSLLVEVAGDGLAAGAPAARGWAAALMLAALCLFMDADTASSMVPDAYFTSSETYAMLWNSCVCLALPLAALAGAARLRGMPLAAAVRVPGAPPALFVAAVCAAAPLLLFGDAYSPGAQRGSPLLALLAHVATLVVAVALVRAGHREGRTAPLVWAALITLAWCLRLYVLAGGGFLLTAVFFLAGSGVFALLAWRAGGGGGVWGASAGAGDGEGGQATPAADARGAGCTCTLPACAARLAARAEALAQRTAGSLPPRLRGALTPAGAAQLAFLALFAAARFLPAIVGTRVSLAVRPGGPRDFFSFGDFITLRYDIESGVRERARACEGGNVYAILAPPAAAGGSWTLEDAVSSPPSLFSGKVFVAGTCTYGGFSFGANAYFVEEGAGRRWKQQSLLIADVAVSPWGQALLLSLRCPALVRPETVASLQEYAEYALVDFFDLCKGSADVVRGHPLFFGDVSFKLPADDRELAAELSLLPLPRLLGALAKLSGAFSEGPSCPPAYQNAYKALQGLGGGLPSDYCLEKSSP